MKSRDVRYFQTMHLCFSQSANKWSDHCDLSQETNPPPTFFCMFTVTVLCALRVVINPLDTLQLQLSPGAACSCSKLMFLLSGEGRKSGWGVRLRVLLCFPSSSSPPPVCRRSEAMTPFKVIEATRWFWLSPGEFRKCKEFDAIPRCQHSADG